MFPRPTNPTGVFEAIDRDDTAGGQKDSISVIKKNMRHSVLLSRAIENTLQTVRTQFVQSIV